MYKRYNLSDIQKEVIKLLKDNNPMSSTEISKKIGTNRITISKYLDILYFQKIISRKKIGSVNFWFLEPGIINFDLRDENYIDLQQRLLMSLINGEKEILENTILSIINKKIDIKKIIIDICFPVFNTLLELHNRGKIGKTEKIHLMTSLTESINLLKNGIETYENKMRKNSILVIVSGDDDSIPICNMINIYAKKIRINTTLIGNVEKYIDPFFDIDFQKFINKLFNKHKEIIFICIISYNEISIKFLYLTLTDNKFKEKIHILIFSNSNTKEKVEKSLRDNIITDISTLIEIVEKEIK